MLKIGDKAPGFSLPDINNCLVSLNDYSGKRIVLWFFPRASTPGWTIEGKGFRDEFNKYQEKDIVIIGCSADSINKQKKFCDKYKFQFPMICDENHDVLKSYGVWGEKKFMGKKYMGISRVTYVIGINGLIENVYDKVNTLSHADDIFKDLNK